MRFGRIFGLCLLVSALTIAVNSPKTSAINYGRGLSEMCDSAARTFGFGWADGYNACKPSEWSLKSNLPPQSFVAYKRDQAKSQVKPSNHQPLRMTFYDRFDSGCESCCDVGPEVVPAEMPSNEDMLPPVLEPVEQQDVSAMRSDSVPAITASTPMFAGGAPRPVTSPEVEAVFKSFADDSFAENVAAGEAAPTHTAQLPQQAIRPRGSLSLPPESTAGAEFVYPTLIAPPRAQPNELGATAPTPALRRLQRKPAPSVQEASQSAGMSVPEALRDYSTPSQTDEVLPADAASQRVWIIGTSEDGPMLKRGAFFPPQKPETEPVMKAANRPAYPVDNVIRQPGIQR